MSDIRKYVTLIETAESNYITSSREGNVMWLDAMVIPPSIRGTGIGEKVYREWEKGLPRDIEYVHIVPVEDSDMFWKKMGFDYLYYEDDDPDMEVPNDMVKGVNGKPTPKEEYDTDDGRIPWG